MLITRKRSYVKYLDETGIYLHVRGIILKI